MKNGGGYSIIDIPTNGKTREQVHEVVLKYFQERPQFKIMGDRVVEGKADYITYRNFSAIGSKDKCLADLVTVAYLGIVIEKPGKIQLLYDPRSTIYASMHDAKLLITPAGDVASINDLPFDTYRFIQPEMKELSVAGTRANKRKSAKIDLELAYPDSIFDLDGDIVNVYNKNTIEAFYDNYVTDLKAYLDEHIK